MAARQVDRDSTAGNEESSEPTQSHGAVGTGAGQVATVSSSRCVGIVAVVSCSVWEKTGSRLFAWCMGPQ